jgi:hypothetical protein
MLTVVVLGIGLLDCAFGSIRANIPLAIRAKRMDVRMPRTMVRRFWEDAGYRRPGRNPSWALRLYDQEYAESRGSLARLLPAQVLGDGASEIAIMVTSIGSRRHIPPLRMVVCGVMRREALAVVFS